MVMWKGKIGESQGFSSICLSIHEVIHIHMNKYGGGGVCTQTHTCTFLSVLESVLPNTDIILANNKASEDFLGPALHYYSSFSFEVSI